MNEVSRLPARGALAMITLAVIGLALPRTAGATCPNPQPMQHGLGSFFTNCPDLQPVDGYLFVLGQDATLNNDSTAPGAGADQKIDFVCEATGVQTEQLIDCTPEAGIAGDGNISVMFDWGGINLSNGNACPNPLGVSGVGRNVIQVVANDGSSLIATVGFSLDFGFYLVEAAHPVTAGMDVLPIACSYNNGLTIVSGGGGNICVNQGVPPVFSDCDPGTVGSVLGTCQGDTGTPLTVTPGNLYIKFAPCNRLPDLRRASWTLLATSPGSGGSKCAVYNPSTDGSCAFFGASSFFGDGANAPAESPFLTGAFRGPCCIAAVDKVAIKNAELRQGRLHVDFATENEATIVGFNVYGGAAKLNSGLIPAQGQGSNAYTFDVGRGALKNERSITVEAVLSNGMAVRTDPVSLK